MLNGSLVVSKLVDNELHRSIYMSQINSDIKQHCQINGNIRLPLVKLSRFSVQL